jgi:hypothetical protein
VWSVENKPNIAKELITYILRARGLMKQVADSALLSPLVFMSTNAEYVCTTHNAICEMD